MSGNAGGEEMEHGLRTERVTLEITRPVIANYPADARHFMWQHLLRDVVQGDRESVRVVEEPHGCLTDRDRKTLIDAAVFCSGKGERGTSEAIEWILARSTPPKVRLPEPVGETKSHGPLLRKRDVLAALAAAGVEVVDA